jgi:hypothetical protein
VGSVAGPLVRQQEWDLYLIEARMQRYTLPAGLNYRLRLQVFSQWLTKQERKAQVTRYVAV